MIMVEMIGKREGLGDILAEGTKRAAGKIGHGATEYAMQTYYEMVGWDPERAIPTAGKLHELDLSWVIEELNKTVTKK